MQPGKGLHTPTEKMGLNSESEYSGSINAEVIYLVVMVSDSIVECQDISGDFVRDVA